MLLLLFQQNLTAGTAAPSPQPAAPVSLSGGSGGGMGGYGQVAPYGAHVASERSKRIKRQNEVILQAVAALFGSNNT